MNKKIEIELDQELYMNLHIIAKGLNMDLNQCLLFILRKEVKFLKDNVLQDNAKNDLETYYNFEINLDDLKKLILIEEVPLIAVEPEIYQKLKKLSEITGISVKDIASAELGDSFYSIGDIPVVFLDRHLGIKNIKNPIEMLEKMDEVINIGSKHLEGLKTKDLIKHVKDWHNK